MEQLGGWQIVALTDQHAQEICRWSYPPPYDCYNWPAWDTMLADELEFADPLIREQQYRAVLNEAGALCGFAQWFPILGVTRLGLGLRPDLCGNGLGAAFVRLIAEEAARRAPMNEIDLEVLTWNERAVRTYAKAGFSISDTYERGTPAGIALFHCMVYAGNAR